jgi:hypothetical protein
MDFEGFPKIPRFSRECIVTEKIDGTNAQILIEEVIPAITEIPDERVEPGWLYLDRDDRTYRLKAGSRTRWIKPDNDNHGFARWAYDNARELTELGPGRHFGEWWGQGIQRGYGLKEKRFSLFNVIRWDIDMFTQFKFTPWVEREGDKSRGPEPVFKRPPECCHVVPVILTGRFGDIDLNLILRSLSNYGSFAAPGFMDPEGIVIYHTAGGCLFKKTIRNDEGKNQ